ncbi:MAG: hypothetical protein AB8C13_04090 [Phycisphaerales bacterium]
MKYRIALLALASVGAVAHAGMESQVVSFNAGFDGDQINFDRFDTMGGTRELTGLSLSYDQTITLDLTVESNGYTALQSGDWLIDTGFIALHQFGLNDGRGGEGGEGAPFIGPGAVFDQLTGDLGISDGYNGTGPDALQFQITDSFVFDASYDTTTDFGQRMIDTFTGEAQLETFLGGFSELFFQWINDPNWIVDPNNPPDGPFDGPFIDPFYGIFVNFDAFSHAGDITVNYEYRNVPTPAGLSLLAGAGLMASRRRRS